MSPIKQDIGKTGMEASWDIIKKNVWHKIMDVIKMTRVQITNIIVYWIDLVS